MASRNAYSTDLIIEISRAALCALRVERTSASSTGGITRKTCLSRYIVAKGTIPETLNIRKRVRGEIVGCGGARTNVIIGDSQKASGAL